MSNPKRHSSLRSLARSLSTSVRGPSPKHDHPSSGRRGSIYDATRWPASDTPLMNSVGKHREYVSHITGNWIIESSGPSKILIEDNYCTSTLITTSVRLRETATDDSIAALDTAACSSFIWAYEARTKFSPTNILRASSPIEFISATGPMYASEYVIADLYLPCNHEKSDVLAKTTAILFLCDDPLPGGVDILLGMDYLDAQCISIIAPLKTAVIGRCGNAQVPLTFETRHDWPLRRSGHFSPYPRSDQRFDRQVLMITAPGTSSGKFLTNTTSADASSLPLPKVSPVPWTTDIITPKGPHPHPLRSSPGSIKSSNAPNPRVVTPAPLATDDNSAMPLRYTAPIRSTLENNLVRLVSIPAKKSQKNFSRPTVRADDIPQRSSSKTAAPSESEGASMPELFPQSPLRHRFFDLAPELRTLRPLRVRPSITLPVLNPRPVTISDKDTFRVPRSVPKAPTRKVFVHAGRVIKKAVSKVVLRKEGNALTSSDVTYSTSDSGSSSPASPPPHDSIDEESVSDYDSKVIRVVRRESCFPSSMDFEPETRDDKSTALSERVISPYTRKSQIDPVTSARYGAEEDAIKSKKTWI